MGSVQPIRTGVQARSPLAAPPATLPPVPDTAAPERERGTRLFADLDPFTGQPWGPPRRGFPPEEGNTPERRREKQGCRGRKPPTPGREVTGGVSHPTHVTAGVPGTAGRDADPTHPATTPRPGVISSGGKSAEQLVEEWAHRERRDRRGGPLGFDPDNLFRFARDLRAAGHEPTPEVLAAAGWDRACVPLGFDPGDLAAELAARWAVVETGPGRDTFVHATALADKDWERWHRPGLNPTQAKVLALVRWLQLLARRREYVPVPRRRVAGWLGVCEKTAGVYIQWLAARRLIELKGKGAYSYRAGESREARLTADAYALLISPAESPPATTATATVEAPAAVGPEPAGPPGQSSQEPARPTAPDAPTTVAAPAAAVPVPRVWGPVLFQMTFESEGPGGWVHRRPYVRTAVLRADPVVGMRVRDPKKRSGPLAGEPVQVAAVDRPAGSLPVVTLDPFRTYHHDAPDPAAELATTDAFMAAGGFAPAGPWAVSPKWNLFDALYEP